MWIRLGVTAFLIGSLMAIHCGHYDEMIIKNNTEEKRLELVLEAKQVIKFDKQKVFHFNSFNTDYDSAYVDVVQGVVLWSDDNFKTKKALSGRTSYNSDFKIRAGANGGKAAVFLFSFLGTD